MKRVVSIDWLELYCSCWVINDNNFYYFEKQLNGTPQFKELWFVYDKITNEKYCEVKRLPHSPIIPKDATMVKVCNRFLYERDWNARLMHFLNVCHIVPKSISRIDIAADFNRFDKNLHPVTFIKNFLNNKYLKMGNSKYSLEGEQKGEQKFSYIRFGSRENEISSYLYNKSKELKEVKDKPYIRELWVRNGLNTDVDVWRLEVSLRTVQMRIIEKKSGELLRLDLDYLKTQGIIENIYNCAVLKAFSFKINDGQAKKCRMKDVPLFVGMSSSLLMTTPTNKACTGRMDKIIVKKLANAIQNYRIENEYEANYINSALSVILTQTDLWEYYMKKIEPFKSPFKGS